MMTGEKKHLTAMLHDILAAFFSNLKLTCVFLARSKRLRAGNVELYVDIAYSFYNELKAFFWTRSCNSTIFNEQMEETIRRQ